MEGAWIGSAAWGFALSEVGTVRSRKRLIRSQASLPSDATHGAVASNHHATMRTDEQASGRKHTVRHTSRTLGRRRRAAANRTNVSPTDAANALPTHEFSPGGSHSSTPRPAAADEDRKSTRLNSSHLVISYAVFCLKKKKTIQTT